MLYTKCFGKWFSLSEDGPHEFYFEGREEFPSPGRKEKEDWEEEIIEYV